MGLPSCMYRELLTRCCIVVVLTSVQRRDVASMPRDLICILSREHQICMALELRMHKIYMTLEHQICMTFVQRRDVTPMPRDLISVLSREDQICMVLRKV